MKIKQRPQQAQGARKKSGKADRGGRGPQSLLPVAPRYVPYFNFVLGGFVHLALVGGVLLILPFASATGEVTSPVTAFFTAISAVSATGLVVVDTHDHWSPWGQFIIMVLIQIGGLGFMTLTAFLLLMLRHRVNVQDDLVTDTAGFGGQRHFLLFAWGVLVVTVIIEAVGSFLLFLGFRQMGVGNPIWRAAFHSISAFNNAGFDLQGGFSSLVGLQRETYLLGVIAGLLILGGLGVPLLLEILTKRPWSRWSLDAKLSISSVFWLVVLGALAVLGAELLGRIGTEVLSPGEKAMNAFFLSASARTAGFASLDIGRLTLQTLLVLMVLMFIGGVSGSTAGGVKVNTFATIVLTAVSYLRGQRRVHVFKRVIPEAQVHRAIAVVFLGVSFIFIVTVLLTITDHDLPFVSLLFEVVSASTTTGYTTGITPELTTGGKVLLMLAMFVGRLGPVTAVLALARRAQVAPEPDEPEEAIRIG